MTTKILTLEQVQKKYKGKYIEVRKRYDGLYEVSKSYSVNHENTTLGEDVGTSQAYRR